MGYIVIVLLVLVGFRQLINYLFEHYQAIFPDWINMRVNLIGNQCQLFRCTVDNLRLLLLNLFGDFDQLLC